jgi:2-oxoglutarate ferredoxin oxidoreductase subunit gamma
LKETGILVAGSGGQGILLLGRLIAYGGMLEGREVTCFPSYGAEVRGGTANSTVIISDDLIGSPIIRNPDILVVLNEESLKKFQSRLKPEGVMIFDSSLIKSPELRQDVRAVSIPASDIAASIGEDACYRNPAHSPSRVRSANMVMLGALVAETGILKAENAVRALEKLTSAKSRKVFEDNRDAVAKGIEYIEDKKS